MTLPSLPALVPGVVRHARRGHRGHAFAHRGYQWLVDLDHLPSLPRGLRWAAGFRSADHVGDPSRPIKDNVLDLVRGADGPADDVRRVVMLANARVAGYVFNPISVHWCLDGDDRPVAVVAEVHNTYGERHAYVLTPDEQGRSSVAKELYVSPFNEITGHYRIRTTLTGSAVRVQVALHDGGPGFGASFVGQPEPLRTGRLLRLLLRHPLMTGQVSALIRVHGIWLWARGHPVIPRTPHATRPQPPTIDRTEPPATEEITMTETTGWAGHRVWIIGASHGIGAALARELTAAGASVAISARNRDDLTAVAGSTMVAVPVDATDRDGVASAARDVADRLGGIDTVVYSAGYWKRMKSTQWDADAYERHVQVNLLGLNNVIAAVLPDMVRSGTGRLACIASVAGYRGLPGSEAYGATKAAQINQLEAMRAALAPAGVEIVTVCPGFVKTEMTEGNPFPMPFIIEAEEAARSIRAGLEAGRQEIVFPTRMAALMKLARLLPVRVWTKIAKPRKSKERSTSPRTPGTTDTKES